MDVADLVTVVRGYRADNFEHHSLEVHLGPRGLQMSDGRAIFPQRVVVAGDDVPKLCCFLPQICYTHYIFSNGWEWIGNKVDVEIKVLSNAFAEDEEDSCDKDPPSVKRLLEPFRQLYGYHVTVEGPVATSYKKSIEASAAEEPPSPSDVVRMVSKGRDEGYEAFQKGSLGIALLRYQSALHVMTSAYKLLEARRSSSAERQIYNKSDLVAMDVVQLNLRSLLAETYLKVEEFAKSYACAQDLDTWYSLRTGADISVAPDRVRIFLCKALAGKALGEPIQALRDIDEALSYSPNDEALKEERKVLCGLVRKKLQSDVRMTWADGLNARTGKLKKPNQWRKVKRSWKRSKNSQPAAEGYSLRERKDLEWLMDESEFA